MNWSSLGGCRYQRRSICHDTSGLGNLTNSPGCSMKLRLLCNRVAEQGRHMYKRFQLVSEMCNSLWGNYQGSPASMLPPYAVSSDSLDSLGFISSCFAKTCRRPGAVGGGGVESMSTPCAPFYLHPEHTFPLVCMCKCMCMCLGGSAPAWSTQSAAALLPSGGACSLPADAGVKANAP